MFWFVLSCYFRRFSLWCKVLLGLEIYIIEAKRWSKTPIFCGNDLRRYAKVHLNDNGQPTTNRQTTYGHRTRHDTGTTRQRTTTDNRLPSTSLGSHAIIVLRILVLRISFTRCSQINLGHPASRVSIVSTMISVPSKVSKRPWLIPCFHWPSDW